MNSKLDANALPIYTVVNTFLEFAGRDMMVGYIDPGGPTAQSNRDLTKEFRE